MSLDSFTWQTFAGYKPRSQAGFFYNPRIPTQTFHSGMLGTSSSKCAWVARGIKPKGYFMNFLTMSESCLHPKQLS